MLGLIIAEDEPTTCENMIASIDWKQYGFEILGVAGDGRSAYQLINEKEPDNVLIDIAMPVMRGLDVIRRIREEDQISPVFIIISGYDAFTYVQEALHLRVDGYLLKPFNPNELMSKLQQSISRISVANHMLADYGLPGAGEQRPSRRRGENGCIRYPYDCEQPLINCIVSGERAQLPALVDAFLEAAHSANPGSYKYYHCFLIIYAEICRLLSRRGCSVSQLHNMGNCTTANLDASIRVALHETALSALDRLNEDSEGCLVVSRVEEYLKAHYSEKLMLKDIAEQVHVSPAYLSNLFSRRTGTTITAYLQNLRIDAAREMLANLNYTLTEIAIRVGYPDAKYFSQVFKQVCGVTPSAYRNQRH